MKIILITNMPTPYRLPLWDALKKIVDLEVICISHREKSREWNTDDRSYIYFLKSYHLFFQKKDWALHLSLPFNLFFKLIKQSPDVLILTGYDAFQYWEALLYAKLFRKKKILWSGTTLLSENSKNKSLNLLKKYFVTQFDTYYTYGSEATKYIETFGIKSNDIVTGTNTVDTNFYKMNTISNSRKSDQIEFLYVGRLIELKGLQNTIPAFSKLKMNNWHFTIVGSGTYEEELQSLVEQYALNDKITFVGNKQKEEILNYYSHADVLILPSYREVWGLVLNEALASGLFCLASKYAGATYDLIEDRKNGYIIDPKNIDDIVEKIEKAFDTKFNKKEIKDTFNVSYEEEARKMHLAVNKAYDK